MSLDITDQSLWGTFDLTREHLYLQFQDTPFDRATGLPPDELEREAEAFLAANPAMPRVLQKANVYRILVTWGQITVDPLDWFADKLNHGNILRKLRDCWYEEARQNALETEVDWFAQAWQLGIGRGLLDIGHISPGWQNMFSGGLDGFLEQVRQQRHQLGSTISAKQAAFYEAVEMVYTATNALAERFTRQARQMALEFPEHAGRMTALAEVCGRVPAKAPRSLHEALQFAWLMHELIEMEGEDVRSMGHFDRMYLPYYQADLAVGSLTREQAKELIQFFWFKYHARTQGCQNGKNFAFGGQYADGSEVTNDLTYLALESYEVLNTPDPKLSVRFTPHTEDRLYHRVADLIRKGHNSFVLMNDAPAVEAMVKLGVPPEDARQYLPIGCYEPAVDGKEAGCTMNIVVSLAKAVELAMYDGADPLSGTQVGPHTGNPRTFTDFEQLFTAYQAQMEFLITRFVVYTCAHERQWSRINPSPLIAGTIDDCLARGKDVGQGGAHYNSVGCVGVGLANTCDSLLALKKVVFDEAKFTMEEVLDALEHDFQGREPLRQTLRNRLPKWGNDNPDADALARRIADHFCDFTHTFTNARGGRVRASLFTLDYQWRLGQNTGATPDGRYARTSLAPGVGASTGLDRNGVTALINSVSRLDFTKTPNGSVLDITLHPSAVQGDDGLEAFVNLIKTFFAQGGYAMQFNVVDIETLREAQRDPEKYANLQIRVTGWSVYFVNLSSFEQEQFIARIAHKM